MMRIIIGHLAAQPIKSEDDKVNEFIFIHLGYFLSSFTAASASATGFSKKILQLLYDLLDIIMTTSAQSEQLKLICNVHIPIVYLSTISNLNLTFFCTYLDTNLLQEL